MSVVFLFSIACVDPLPLFLQRSRGLSRGPLRPPPSAHERVVSSGIHLREQSRRRGPGGGKPSRRRERPPVQSPPLPPISASLVLSLLVSSQLSRGAPLSFSRDSDRPRRRATLCIQGGTTREKKELGSKTKLEERVQRRPAIASPLAAGCSIKERREREHGCSYAYFLRTCREPCSSWTR